MRTKMLTDQEVKEFLENFRLDWEQNSPWGSEAYLLAVEVLAHRQSRKSLLRAMRETHKAFLALTKRLKQS